MCVCVAQMWMNVRSGTTAALSAVKTSPAPISVPALKDTPSSQTGRRVKVHWKHICYCYDVDKIYNSDSILIQLPKKPKKFQFNTSLHKCNL